MNLYKCILYYHYILSRFDLTEKFDPDFFPGKECEALRLCFAIAKDFVTKYRETPSAEQVKELIRTSEYSDIVTPDIIDTIYANIGELRNYSDEWLESNVIAWGKWTNFGLALRTVNSYFKLNDGKIGPEQVEEAMEHMKGAFNRSCILEVGESESEGADFWDAKSHRQIKMKRYSTGYPFVDSCMNGGYFSGSLVIFVGAPKIGKSLWLQNLCVNAVKKGYNSAYISLELSEEMVIQRMGSNMFNINSLTYDETSSDEVKMKKIINDFRKDCVGPVGELAVKQFPTSAASVLDVENYLLKKEESLSTENVKFKFKNIYVDYINILKNYRNPNTDATYMKIKQIAEDLRAIAIKHDWCIISATQTSKDQYDTNDMVISQISESSGLGATADLVFGIIATAEMRCNNKFLLKCLLDRVSPKADWKKEYDVNHNYMRICENNSPAYQDSISGVPDSVQANLKNFFSKKKQERPVIESSAERETPAVGIRPNTNFDSMAVTQAPETQIFETPISITGIGLFDN